MLTNKEAVGSKSIPFRLIEQKEEVNNLVIVLPGAAYTTQAPLLHFTTGVFYNKGFDVLHINYTFSREEMSVLSDEDFAKNVQLVIDKAIEGRNYNNFYVVGKSIGTIALSYLLKNTRLKDAKAVWLTPLLQRNDVFNAMANSENKGLCIIGDRDSCFVEDRFEKLKNNRNLLLKVVEGGNHGLELDGEPIKSIELLKDVIQTINEF
ncbi:MULTISPECIES: alpha/beta hydrolase [Sutcliffiella]|uniref:alpha/beta hydrolase n=1 Tax=Sutcliffiella TaxID=2837511 RepID=UPI000B1A17C3|nr:MULTISPECIES: alpha/beta hydrolase [Sutcliffiella]WBL17010.1 alpha/beta hydrolase [Sutcliffiella sp. NC1]